MPGALAPAVAFVRSAMTGFVYSANQLPVSDFVALQGVVVVCYLLSWATIVGEGISVFLSIEANNRRMVRLMEHSGR